jgi:hypothetical protein
MKFEFVGSRYVYFMTANSYQALSFYQWPILLSIAILSFYFFHRVTK